LDVWEMMRQEKSFNAEPVFYGNPAIFFI